MTKDDVCVTIINQSGQETKSLMLSHEKNTINIANLTNGSSTSVVFRSPGENVYNITAILNSGDTLVSREKYIEGGYREGEVITKDSIRTQNNNSY